MGPLGGPPGGVPAPPPVVGAIAIPGPGLLNRFFVMRIAALVAGLVLYSNRYNVPGAMMTGVACFPYPYNFIYPILLALGLNYMGLSIL